MKHWRQLMWSRPVEYHSDSIEFLTSVRKPDMGQWQSGSLTGAVAS